MSESTRQWTKMIREKFPFVPGHVLEIGSLNVNGTVKDLFPDARTYTGIDMREGKDVDAVINSHDIPANFSPRQFDTVICMNMLEHDDRFWITLAAIDYVLENGGYLFIVVPTFNFPVHDHPRDYWRIGEDAFRDVLFAGYELKNLETIPTKIIDTVPRNFVICGFGRKP